jgi:hypothetical protein
MRRALSCCLALAALAALTGATTFTYLEGTSTTMLTPNSIASNGYTASSATPLNPAGYLYCRFQATLAFTAAPLSAGAAVNIWVRQSLDGGTLFDDTPTSAIVTQTPYVVIPLAVGTGVSASRSTVSRPCPPGVFHIVAQLSGTGQTTTASTNTIVVKPYTIQGN